MTIGLHIMRPTSIAVAGGGTETASIRSDGGVDFANATSLSLNGVFTANYDNYMISIRHVNSTAGQSFEARLRSSGSDATGTNYVWQNLRADGTTVDGNRFTSQSSYRIGSAESNLRSGLVCYVYGPHLAQPTAFRSVGAEADSSVDDARVYDVAGTHSLSTAYDGITLYPGAGALSGMITVYGYAQ